MRLLFWLSALTIAYVYVGYPVLLTVWARVSRRRECDPHSRIGASHSASGGSPLAGRDARCAEVPELPTVSIVIAAHNEAARLPARIDNLLALDYPADRRQIVVVSDGSTDGTLRVLEHYSGSVDVVDAPRGGKAVALNAGVARASGEILVFADARQMFAPDAVRALVRPFADRAIGGVTGALVLDCEASDVAGRRLTAERREATADRRAHDRGTSRRAKNGDRRGMMASTIGEGVGLYWRYEKQLRRLESRIGSTLGATGAIYALRRSLYRPLPAGTILDDVLAPMRTVLAGYRVVFSEEAYAFDRAALDADTEQRRKIRTLAGNVQILGLEPRLLVPFVNPVWLQYVSHKIGRLVVPYAMLLLFFTSVALAESHVVYAAALAGQCGIYLLAGYGAWLEFRAAPAGAAAVAHAPGPRRRTFGARLRSVKWIANA